MHLCTDKRERVRESVEQRKKKKKLYFCFVLINRNCYVPHRLVGRRFFKTIKLVVLHPQPPQGKERQRRGKEERVIAIRVNMSTTCMLCYVADSTNIANEREG